jgi:uncharacterized glyoxalase superfamily protein PhnB
MTNVTVQTSARLKALAPQFLVLDLQRALDFYKEKLGFTVEFIYGDFYASVKRDDIALHLKLSDEPDPSRAFRKQGEHLDVYITTDDIDALFTEYGKRGPNFVHPLHTTAWGTREFVVEDPDGYILYFGQPA